MRILVIAVAMLLLVPMGASGCSGTSAKAQVAAREFAVASKKKHKTAVRKSRKPKEEYMRAAPM